MTPTDSVIVRYGELTLKGKNRKHFEMLLKRDIERFLHDRQIPCQEVRLARGRIYVRGIATLPDFRKVLGILSFSPARELPRDDELLLAAIRELIPEVKRHRTFRVRCQRIDKTYPQTSIQVERELGAILHEATGTRVDLEHPALDVNVEIGVHHFYLFHEKIAGHSGFPFGSAGKLVVLLSGGIDSPVAAFLMMKRGVEPVLLHFMVTREEEQKVVRLKEKLEEYTAGRKLRLIVIPRKDLFLGRFEELFGSRYESYVCVMCKSLMHRMAARIAAREQALGIVTGDNLAQVASQTLKNLAAQRQWSRLPIYSPLIAFEKTDTITIARAIGTYDLSIVPAPGCTPPKNPKTAVPPERLARVLAENGLSEEDIPSETNFYSEIT